MSSSSKDRGTAGSNHREDCQIHVDKEGESCVIKIESVGHEKMLKEVLERLQQLNNEVQRTSGGHDKQLLETVQSISNKLKPLSDQLVEIKQDVKEQQRSKGTLEKMLDKVDHLDQTVKSFAAGETARDEGQKRLSSDLQHVREQMPLKSDLKPMVDALQQLHSSLEKEKHKPDILARKLDSIDQKLKESQPEHTALIKELQTKLEPVHRATPQTSETLMKINDRVKAMHADTNKVHPDLLKRLDEIDQHLTELLNPLVEQQKNSANAKKEAEERLGSPPMTDSPTRVPLCVNGMIPALSDPHVLTALAGDIAKKLAEIQTKLLTADEFKRKQDELIGTIAKQQQQEKDPQQWQRELEKNLRPLTQKLNELAQRPSEAQMSKEISSRTEPLQQSVDNLSKQQQPLVELLRQLPKQVDGLLQTHSQAEKIKELTAKIDPLTQSVKAMKENIEQRQNPGELKKLSDDIQTLIQRKNEPTRQPSKESLKTTTEGLMKKIDALEPLTKVPEQMQHLAEKIDQISSTKPARKASAADVDQQQTNQLIKDFPKQNKEINDRLKHLHETLEDLPERISTKFERTRSTNNLQQVPLSQSSSTTEGEKANLMANLLTLQTAVQNSKQVPLSDMQQYLKRLEQSPLVRNDRDLLGLIQRIADLGLKNEPSEKFVHPTTPQRSPVSDSRQQSAEIEPNEPLKPHRSPPADYLTRSRYISTLNEKSIREHWPKLSSRANPIIQAILNEPYEFDNGTNLDRLIKQQDLESYASLTRQAMEKSNKDYDKLCSMMDSIVFDQMTMIGGREAVLRPWNPSLLNRASSKGFYPYAASDGRRINRFPVQREIVLWMVETDEKKLYQPTQFFPDSDRLAEKYGRIQQPQFNEISLGKREDETRWNERYAFTKDNRTVLFVNDLRSYFMDYDTKRKYQVHDGVPINPVCRTGIAGRGDLPFWGPNHCVVIILLRNLSEPEVILMRHHGDAFVLPKGFYGREARYDNQLKIIQDPVSGQILPQHLLDHWWTQVQKYNEATQSTNHLKRVLNDKELKEEFAEIFSQKGCNKSVFDNGYVDHPLNTDHAWVESSVWKIQFKDWRIPEMKASKYAIAADDPKKNPSGMSFVWMKLTDALLLVPPFDRGLLVDVLATGMPL